MTDTTQLEGRRHRLFRGSGRRVPEALRQFVRRQRFRQIVTLDLVAAVQPKKIQLLQVFDAKTYEKVKDIPIGDRCWHFSFTPDDKQILVACGKSNELVVIDAASLEVTKHLGEMGMPWGIVTYPKAMGSIDRP